MPLHSASLHAAAFGADDGGCHPAEAAAAAQAGLLPAGHPAWPGLRASARRRAAAVALLDSGGPLHGGVPAVRPPRAQRLAAAFEKVAEAKVGDAHGKADGKGRSDDALVASNAKYISALAGPVTLVSSLLCVAAACIGLFQTFDLCCFPFLCLTCLFSFPSLPSHGPSPCLQDLG
ncbi:unnamed protein product [Prorocentrum cordatum]|uniref:H(+)-exporting diphosphatase n=1 Tax=Prorocentrum cordatum TaxID=2364126 RepID=A0ABN9XPW2_9DINO|nr:unnamed protein product [Polarella glacialis]